MLLFVPNHVNVPPCRKPPPPNAPPAAPAEPPRPLVPPLRPRAARGRAGRPSCRPQARRARGRPPTFPGPRPRGAPQASRSRIDMHCECVPPLAPSGPCTGAVASSRRHSLLACAAPIGVCRVCPLWCGPALSCRFAPRSLARAAHLPCAPLCPISAPQAAAVRLALPVPCCATPWNA
ncbi:MAG: hypothetical protein J3K34DRAFT_424139, partial [Monoraphidium minutum]